MTGKGDSQSSECENGRRGKGEKEKKEENPTLIKTNVRSQHSILSNLLVL